MPTWQPSGSTFAGVAAVGSTAEDVRMGTNRPSMSTNPLLAKAELGKVKMIQFNAPTQEHVFGYVGRTDPEGAREVTMIWKPHQATVAPGVLAGHETKRTPDFKALNKLAVIRGGSARLQRDGQMPNLRSGHHYNGTASLSPSVVPARRAQSATSGTRPAPAAYGMASSHRTADTVRNFGAQEPHMKHVVQGAFQDDWVKTNALRDAHHVERPYIPPVATRTTMGHALGAQKYLTPECHDPAWKMSKFKAAPPRVTQHMGGPTGSSMRPPRAQGASEYDSYMVDNDHMQHHEHDHHGHDHGDHGHGHDHGEGSY